MWSKGRAGPGPGEGKPRREAAMSEQADLILKKKKEIEAKMAAVAKIKENNTSEKKEKKPISLSISKRWGLKGKKDTGAASSSSNTSTSSVSSSVPMSSIPLPRSEGHGLHYDHTRPVALPQPPPSSVTFPQPPPAPCPYPQPPAQSATYPPPPPLSVPDPYPPTSQPPRLSYDLSHPPPPPPSQPRPYHFPPPPMHQHHGPPPGPPCPQPLVSCPPPPVPQPQLTVPPPHHLPPPPPGAVPGHLLPAPPPALVPDVTQQPPMTVPPPISHAHLVPPPVPAPVPAPDLVSVPAPAPVAPPPLFPSGGFHHQTPPPPDSFHSGFALRHSAEREPGARSRSRSPGRDADPGLALPPVVEELAQMVAVSGEELETIARERNKNTPELGFLHDRYSVLYRSYRTRVVEIKKGLDSQNTAETPPDPAHSPQADSNGNGANKRKRKSRWGGKDEAAAPPPTVATPAALGAPGVVLPTALGAVAANVQLAAGPAVARPQLSAVRAANPSLLAYAQRVFGSVDLDEDQWKQCEDQMKMAALYAELAAKQVQARIQKNAGPRTQFDYDSDEDTEGGTWEHKQRMMEMAKTQTEADKLTSALTEEGKHHIGDFLPPEELSKFLNKYKVLRNSSAALEESAFQENKLDTGNKGFKLLQKMGWSEGQGLGASAQGIVNPIGKSGSAGDRIGLGADTGGADEDDDEFDQYRKRMMLAYRFRPNPLNNPRRSYY